MLRPLCGSRFTRYAVADIPGRIFYCAHPTTVGLKCGFGSDRSVVSESRSPPHENRPVLYFVLKFLHLIGAAVLLGTGAGIAFFMLAAHLGKKPEVIAGVARIVVIADFVFTATAVVTQPITGVLLAWTVGYPLSEGWIVWSVVLYCVAGAFWLPVVWMQMRMRDLASQAMHDKTPLPAAYHRLFWLWFSFGFPAFAAVTAIFWLMIARPQI
jgi:uncharacterized membrane protein